MTICMTNGGMYNNIVSINNTKITELDSIQIIILFQTYDYLNIEFKNEKKVLLCTKCISSVNFFD